MTALDLIATLGVATSVAILVVRVWLLANTLEIGSPPAPPEDPPTTDPAVTPSDPYDTLLVDLELFRLTTMAPSATELPSRLSAVPEDAVVAQLDAVGGRGHLTRDRTATACPAVIPVAPAVATRTTAPAVSVPAP